MIGLIFAIFNYYEIIYIYYKQQIITKEKSKTNTKDNKMNFKEQIFHELQNKIPKKKKNSNNIKIKLVVKPVKVNKVK